MTTQGEEEMTSKMTLIATFLVAATAALAAAPGAQAEGLFEVEKTPSTLSGAQTETIKLEMVGKETLGSIECGTATLSGEITTSTASKIEAQPSFSKCKLGVSPVEFMDHECKLVIHGGKEIEKGEEPEFENPIDNSCPEKEEKVKVEFHIPGIGCVISIAAQVSIGDLFIKVHWFALPPDLLIGSRVGKITGAIENTPGKICKGLPLGAVTLNVYGGLTLHAVHSGVFVGLGLK
jgi:hypothetical protein